jgi:gas vesicle protein
MYEPSAHLNDMNDVRGTWGVRGFTVGVLIGAGVALLLAPATGTDTRKKIGAAAKRIGNDARHKLDTARHRVGGLKQDAKAAVEAGRDAYMRSRSQGTESRTGDISGRSSIQAPSIGRTTSTRPA